MDLASAGLTEQPFRTDGRTSSTVSYRAYRDALALLKKTCDSFRGLLVLQGPALSGKSTLLREFVATIPDDSAVALIDGAGLNTEGLLQAMLRHFGYLLNFDSTGEMLAMVRVFALQQTSSGCAPIVIIENAHDLNPSAWRALNELADLRVRQTSALKFVFVSDRSLHELLEAPIMETIAKRLTADFHLRPMTSDEAQKYLFTKLRAAGSDVPEFIFPVSVCNELWRASGGWPGILDRLALLALTRAETLPVSVSAIEQPALPFGTWDASIAEPAPVDVGKSHAPPTLHVTFDGETIKSLVLEKSRLLIGRAVHNDLSIDSRFASRHHMLLVRSGDSTFLIDLNSTNGSFVNSRRVFNHMLINDDIITVGQHHIKFCDPHAKFRSNLEGDELSDTATMKTLEDVRTQLAEDDTAIPSA